MRFHAYEDIQLKVQEFCQQYGIQLVIRFNREPIDKTKPQEVMIGIQRPIVYQNALDITNHIIRALGAQPTTHQYRHRQQSSHSATSYSLSGRWFWARLRFATTLEMTDWATLSHSLRQQNTIAEPVRVSGFGYWSGRDVRVEFRPAPVNTGVVFVRPDGGRPQRIQAVVANRVEIPRRTTLQVGGTSVEMVEHIMASLAGLQIDNCEVWVNGAEMPGCDGSSRPFVEALCSVRRVTQEALRKAVVVTRTIRVGDAECWVEVRPSAGGLSIGYRLDYGSEGPIGQQTIQLALSPRTFCDELAAARTFILKHEAEWLRQQGLGERVTCSDLLVFNDTGPVDNVLRYEDECVRHKALDLVGDLALAGCDIIGHVEAYRSGHRLNAELVRAVLQQCAQVSLLRRCA